MPQASDDLAKGLADAIRAIICELSESASREASLPPIDVPEWLDDLPDVLTIDDVARVLRIGQGGAYELVRAGDLFAVRIGRSLRVPKPALVAYLGGIDWQATVRQRVDRMLSESATKAITR